MHHGQLSSYPVESFSGSCYCSVIMELEDLLTPSLCKRRRDAHLKKIHYHPYVKRPYISYFSVPDTEEF